MGDEPIPSRPDIEAAANRMFKLLEPVLFEPASAGNFGPLWEGDGWSFNVTVQTDRQRDRILSDPELLDRLEALSQECDARLAEFLGIVVYSHETVDRDYEGNWFYATR